MWISWFIYAAVCLALIGLLFSPFMAAHAEYYDMLIPFTVAPVVCISEGPNEEHQMYKVLAAGLSWREALGNEFYYKLKYKSTDSDCNVMVDFVPNLGSGVLGSTRCYYNFCQIYIATETSYYIDNTVKHEIGHAFGLGHRLPNDELGVGDVARILITNDVMIWANGPFRWILQSDIDALHDMYGSDGWDGLNHGKYNYKTMFNNTAIPTKYNLSVLRN